MQTSGEAGGEISLTRILVALDGSIYSERTLPYARALAKAFNSEIILMSVPAVPDMKSYRAPAEFVQNLRIKADANMRKFIKAVAKSLRQDGLHVQTVVSGSIPAQTIVRVQRKKGCRFNYAHLPRTGWLEADVYGKRCRRGRSKNK